MRVKCLAQEHNTMSPARVRTWSARSGVERTNREATALLQGTARKTANQSDRQIGRPKGRPVDRQTNKTNDETSGETEQTQA